MEPIKETIELRVDASGIKTNSLAGMIQQLKEVDKYIEKVNASLNGMNFTGPARTAKELELMLAKVKNLNTGKTSNFKYEPMIKALGGDERTLANFERFIARQKKAVEGFVKNEQAFRNIPQFARQYAKFEKQSSLSVADLLRPGTSKVHGGTVAGGKIKVDGQVGLVIPGTQITATVSGPITLAVAPGQVQASASGAGNNAPGTGKFTGGNAAGKSGKRKAKSGKAGLAIGEQEGELRRVRTETEDQLREAITVMDEVGNLVTSVHDSVEGIIKTTTRTTTGQSPLARFRELRAIEQEKFKQLKAGLSLADPGFGLAALQKNQAQQLRGLLDPELAGSLGETTAGAIRRKLDEAANSLEAQSQLTWKKAFIKRRAKGYRMEDVRVRIPPPGLPGLEPWMTKRFFKNIAAGGYSGGPPSPPPPFNRGTAREEFSGYGVPALYQRPGGFGGHESEAGRRRRGYGRTRDAEFTDVPPDYIDVESKPVKPKQSKFSKALEEGFSPMGFATHVVKVAGWAAAVGTLYKSLELGEYSMERFIKIGEETAHLAVVFRGVGGSVLELRNDVMSLAAANGRSTEEAMASATEWARLGLTRVQINEAVRVSMIAANVAQMGTEETTKQLSSLMHVYHLQVSDLDGVLGMLTNSSLKYNVTLEDLFQGLDRSAGVAREAGMGLAELQGLLAATVGKTGQSGVTIGNTIKSILVQFSNPAIQKLMRAHGIETTTASGGLKSASEILRDTFVKYQGMNQRARGNFAREIAGRYGASRFIGMMDGYVEAQKLAIDGQLHLNAAQTANVQILETLKAQLAGVRAEWDRLFVNKLAPDLSGGAKFIKNTLRYLNQPNEAPSREDSAEARRLKLDAKIGLLQAREWVASRRDQGRSSGVLASLGHVMYQGLMHPFTKSSVLGTAYGLGDILQANTESSWERNRDKFANDVQKHFGAADANRTGARLFKTVADVLGVKGADNSKNVEDAAETMRLLGVGNPEKFKEQFGRGNLMQAQGELFGARDAAEAKALAEAQAGVVATTERLAAAKAQLAKASNEDEKNEALAAIKEATGAQDAYNQSIQEEDGLRAQQIARSQEYINLLKEQQDVMEALSQLSSQQTLDTMGSRNDAEVRSLQQQKDQLEATQKRLIENDANVEGMPAWDQTTEMLRNVNAQLASKQSPQMQAAIGAYDDRAIAIRRATGEANSFAVGHTEAEKLLNEQKRLKEEIAKTAANPNANANDVVRAQQMQIELAKTQQKIQERIVELRGQEKQIMLEAAREYQKSLLFAGPGELLKRLYVGSVAQKRAPSAGEFMSWDPQSREMYYQLRGGDAGAHNREEQFLLRGQGLTVAGEQGQARENRAAVNKWGDRLGRFTREQVGDASAMPLPNLDALDKQALKTASNFGLLDTATLRLAGKMDDLGKRMDAIIGAGGKGDKSSSKKSFDLAPGYSLGSAPYVNP